MRATLPYRSAKTIAYRQILDKSVRHGAFQRAFAEFGIKISIAQARAPMGAAKRNHIRAILDMSEVVASWRPVLGKPPKAGADHVIDTVGDLPDLVRRIEVDRA